MVATLRDLQARRPGRVTCLKGNHEDMLLRAVRDPRAERHWLLNGGGEALASFGVERAAELPADVLRWIEGCPTAFDDGLRLFVHAGLNPAYGLADQVDDDRLWIRDAFLSAEHDFGRFVVHGHTPRRSGLPDVRRHRVNLDTAAVYGGRLTAGVFASGQASPVAFLSVPARP